MTGSNNAKRWAILWLVFLILLSSCRSAPNEIRQTEFLMDTVVTITAYGPRAAAAVPKAFLEMKRIASLMSADDPASEVSLINKNAGIVPVTVSSETFELLKLCRLYSELSDGAFDVTVRPLVELWGIGKKDDFIPTKEEIDCAKQLVGYGRLLLNDQDKTVFLPTKGMGIDLGGVAKGYATDRARLVLQNYGVESALVDAGGNIFALGVGPSGKKWRIGVRNPRPGLAANDSVIAVVPCQNTTLVTSGDYERYFDKDGTRYHHILDPFTGRPANNDLISVTVVSDSSTIADVLSTAVFVLGPDKGQNLAMHLDIIQMLMVTTDLRIISVGDLMETELLKVRSETNDSDR